MLPPVAEAYQSTVQLAATVALITAVPDPQSDTLADVGASGNIQSVLLFTTTQGPEVTV